VGGSSGRDAAVGYPSNSAKITTTRSSDPVVIDEALDAQQLEVPYIHPAFVHTAH